MNAETKFQHVCLRDVCESVDYGYTASAISDPTGPKLLRITDIASGAINWQTVPHCQIAELDIPKFKLYDGDIVVARTGASTGASAFIQNPPNSVFASYLVRLKVKPNTDPRYISYFLKSKHFASYMHGVLGDKSAQPNSSAQTMTQVRLSIPPVDQQRSIAFILGTLDDKIELNRKMNETLEAMARAIFKSWFVDFDPVRAKAEGRQPIGMDAATAALFPDSFEDSELGEIPRGWSVGTLSELVTITSGKRPVSEVTKERTATAIPLYGGGGVMGYVEDTLYQEPLILTGRVGTLGKVFRIEHPCWPSDNTLLLFPRSPEVFEYALMITRLIDFESLNRGSTQPLVTQGDLNRQRTLIPNSRTLKQFHSIVAPFYRRIDSADRESDSLAMIRDTLLPKLMSGELTVKELPNA